MSEKYNELQKKVAYLKTHTLTDRQEADLELILVGAFNPLSGFLNEPDYINVLNEGRLTSGELWPIPIVLDTEQGDYKVGEEISLIDKYGEPLAILSIESIYSPDKLYEAEKVYGTTDTTHPGVDYLLNKTHGTYLGGKVTPLVHVEERFNQGKKYTPTKLRRLLNDKGAERVVAFQTRNPIHRAHFELISRSASDIDAHVLIHPTIGPTKPGDIKPSTRLKVYEHIIKRFDDGEATLGLVPIAMRMAGPKEALWHALIRKNYGATHFIIGRDHAGPGKDFYGPYEAQDFVLRNKKEIGVEIIPSQELVYVEEEDDYYPLNEIPEGKKVKNISGTEFRKLLVNNLSIPEWFSFPEVISELKKDFNNQGLAIFFTGYSGSGKSTIARLVGQYLEDEVGKAVTILDGDIVRKNLSQGLGFSAEDRNKNIERIGFVASEIVKHGGIVLAPVIAPYKKSRDKNREQISSNGKYIEVYIKTDLDECKKRDVKGLYAKSSLGLIKGVTGVDDPYEEPVSPDLIISTNGKNKEESARELIDFLLINNFIEAKKHEKQYSLV